MNYSDHELAQLVNEEMAKGFITMSKLRKKFCTSQGRLRRLMFIGLVKSLPVKLTKSAGATMQRKQKNLMANWYISRPAEWMTV